MVVIVLECASSSLRGELTRWMMELKAGVFIGTISSRVRDLLWKKIVGSAVRAAFMAYKANNEQGFVLISCGDSRKAVQDFDGLQLILTKEC